ncbi:MAG: lysophospholipid acyltransferase family protein [Opitutia bacterium]
MRALIATYAWLLARLPEGFARANAALLGHLLWILRRRVIRTNLRAAFPDKDEAWVRRIGRLSCRRAAEMGLFSIVSPRLSDEAIRARVQVHPETLAGEARLTSDVGGLVLFVPHFTLMEMMTAVTLAAPALGGRPWVTLYRPLNQPAADAWVKAARERFGMRLASRREGFGELMRNVRAGGVSCILFDQKIQSGRRLTFLGRPAAVTNLPGLVAQKHQAATRIFWAERTGFWRCVLRSAALRSTDAAGLTRESNAWLEGRLRSSDEACADWLWAHDRWRHGDAPWHEEL